MNWARIIIHLIGFVIAAAVYGLCANFVIPDIGISPELKYALVYIVALMGGLSFRTEMQLAELQKLFEEKSRSDNEN